VRVGLGRSGIITSGTLPDGREYCVVQTYRDLVEPYQVSLYVRDIAGTWDWYYLEHEDNAWRDARVEFHDGHATVHRNGELFREIELSSVFKNESLPASLTIAEVEDRHHKKYK